MTNAATSGWSFRAAAGRRGLTVLHLAAAGFGLMLTITYGYYFILSRFSWYDDEGYLMMSVRQVAEGRPLYDEVFSQYGPFYYVVKLASLALLRESVSHDFTRLTTLGIWVLSAGLGGVFTYRATRSAVAALAAYVLLFHHLRPLALEPGHPQELGVLLVTGLATLCALWCAPRQASRLAAACGVVVGALALTKINVGVYAGLAVCLLLLTFASVKGRAVLMGAITAACVAVPWMVMREHTANWAFGYAALVSLGVGSVAAQSMVLVSERPFGARELSRVALTFVLTTAGVCTPMAAGGSSFRGLVDGILLRPLSFAQVFSTEVRVAPAAVVFAALSLLLALSHALWFRMKLARRAERASLLAWAKLGCGLLGVHLASSGAGALLGAGPALLWLLLARPAGEPWTYDRLLPRVALASLAALQTLQAYPVAESQVAWATWLMIPAMVVCAVDGWQALVPRSLRYPPVIVEAVGLAGVLIATQAALQPWQLQRAYAGNTPLSLPGAARIRLPPDEASRYRWLAASVRERCGSLVTLPGLNSLYFWTDLAPPTGANTSAWPILLDAADQQRIVNAVASRRDACVVEYEAGIRTGGRDALVMSQPLMRFVREQFETVDERDGYRFKIRRVTAGTGS